MDEYIEINGEKMRIPDIALGKEIPPGIEKYIELEERARKEKKRADIYAVVSIVSSFVCTIIGWLLGKFC